MRSIDAHAQAATPVADISRYRPMLRLLADEDSDLPSENETRAEIRARRRRLFRHHLHGVAEDYGRLLAGIRLATMQSNCDRPDLAKALLRHRVLFAVALCRIEFRLRIHALGIGSDHLPGVVNAFQVLQLQIAALADFTTWGS